jgi:hypothetical protein
MEAYVLKFAEKGLKFKDTDIYSQAVGLNSHNILVNIGLPLYFLAFIILSIILTNIVRAFARCCYKNEPFIDGMMATIKSYQDNFLYNSLVIFFLVDGFEMLLAINLNMKVFWKGESKVE